MHDRSLQAAKFFGIPQHEAQQLVYAQATYYPRFARVYIPNQPYPKVRPGLEPSEIVPSSRSQNKYTETDVERSIRRTRKVIKDYVFCNNFELFATFTFKKERQDIARCKTKMSNWLKNQQKRKGRFEYLIVPEFHKDKQAIHFHSLIDGYKGELRQSLSSRTGRPLKQSGRDVFEIPSYTLGFTNVKKIDPNTSSIVGFYLQKYITKEMPLFFNKNRYWVSRGLSKPNTEDNPEPWYKVAKPDREYAVDNGKILEFDSGKNLIIDIYLEAWGKC